jgi:hypothetical protein
MDILGGASAGFKSTSCARSKKARERLADSGADVDQIAGKQVLPMSIAQNHHKVTLSHLLNRPGIAGGCLV